MPLFDYHCTACGHDFEMLVRNDRPPACPRCSSARLEKAVPRIAPAGKIEAIRLSNRRAAARQGHLSHYSPAERKKLLRE